MLKIELKPHKIVRNTPYGEVVTDLNQHIVLVNGKEAGYVGNQKGGMFLPLAGFPHQLQPAVDAFIANARGETVVESTPSPPIVDPKTGKVVS